MLATIGYERADLNDFIATLQLSGIDILVDVRDRAQSRRPGFSKTALSDALASANIDYIHFRELGDPKEGREAARSGNFELFRKIFAEVMNTPSAKSALTNITVMASEKHVCLMCFERDQRTCHRKIVSDHLEKYLNEKTKHLGVKHGAGQETEVRRVRYSDKGTTAQVEQVL